jgi:hypothetical protein
MRRQIATAALALGLFLAAAPVAQARDEGIETCLAASCDVGFVAAGGSITALSAGIQKACGPAAGLGTGPVRLCSVEATGPCDSRTIAAGVDGIAAVGSRAVNCGAGFDGVLVYLLH